jgi:tetratricopeptide (TPR) repeat protein
MTQSEGNASVNASGERSVAFSGNITNSTINTGDVINNPPPSPPLTSTPSNLPFVGTENFVGRSKALSSVHEALQGNTRVAITAVAGMGGVGKTELAIQYAQKYRDAYPAGLGWFFVRSSDVGVQILKFASTFGLKPPDNLGFEERVRYVWQHWPVRPVSMVEAKEPGDVLLVFDDVDKFEKVKPYLPLSNARFKVLLTSRVQLGSPIRSTSLDVLAPTDALELLGVLEQNGRVVKEPQEAEELCKRLGYLPLGLELVGCYLASNEDLKLARMLQRLSSAGIADEALNPEEKPELRTAQLGVRAAFELSWEELNEQEQEVACLLSLFAQAPIPWRLVESYRLDWNAKDLEKIRDGKLRKLSLLERSGEGLYRLHPLIREYFGEKILEFAGAEGMKRAHCLTMALEAQGFSDKPTLQQGEGFSPVVPHLEEVADRLLDWVEDEDLRWLFVGLGRFYDGQGAYTKAEPWKLKCLEACRKRFGEVHQYVATSLSNLAEVYQSQGRYKEAEPLHLQALEIYKKCWGMEHLNVAGSLNNLGAFYVAQGYYELAKPLTSLALEMRQRLCAEDLLVAESTNNLAVICQFQGRYKEAEQHFLQVQDLYKKSLGDDQHPEVATLFHNLASMYLNQERYAEAEPLLEKALKLRTNLFGEEHLSVAESLSSLAGMYLVNGRYAEAESLYLQVRDLNKKFLNEEHPCIAKDFGNLAFLYTKQERYAEAEPLYRKALALKMKLLGEEHLDTLACMGSLAKMLKAKGDFDQAELLNVQAVVTCINVLGQQHPTTNAIWQNYLSFLSDISKNHPEAVTKLLSNGSRMTKQILAQMQKDLELGNPTQEG